MTKPSLKEVQKSEIVRQHNFIGKKVKHKREILNYSLQDLANLIGRSKAFIFQVETGKSELTTYDLLRVSKALEVKPIYLIDDNYNIGVEPCDEKYCKNCEKISAIYQLLRN